MMYYTYVVTFLEVPNYYFGLHKHKEGDNYLGSPETHKYFWAKYTPKLTILEWFNTLEEARFAEQSLISPVLNHRLCLNEHNGIHPSAEACSRGGKNSPIGKRSLSFESRSKANKSRVNQADLCSKAGKLGGAKAVESGQLAKARRKSHTGDIQAKRRSKPLEITFPDETAVWFRSARDAELRTGLNRLSLSRAARGLTQIEGHEVRYSNIRG